MLAQNFMSAEALGLTEEQRDAMITTLRAFERGEIKRFYMGSWWCGTAGCIGGWIEELTGCDLSAIFQNSARLDRLLFPTDVYGDTHAIACRDPKKGAQALRNYLVTGVADWEGVMAS